MQEYTIQKGDTIAKVSNLLATDWQRLRELNPGAVGRSTKNGNWFFKEGATVRTDASGKSFAENLAQATSAKQQSASKATPASTPAQTSQPGAIEYTVQPGDTIWDLAVNRYHVNVEDVLQDNDITDPRKLQIGQKLVINGPKMPEDVQDVVASWYGKQFHGRDMANGSPFNMFANTIAHKELPLGTRVELENPETGEKEEAVVSDRGPFIQGRDVDLSYGLATKLSLAEQGVGSLRMRVL